MGLPAANAHPCHFTTVPGSAQVSEKGPPYPSPTSAPNLTSTASSGRAGLLPPGLTHRRARARTALARDCPPTVFGVPAGCSARQSPLTSPPVSPILPPRRTAYGALSRCPPPVPRMPLFSQLPGERTPIHPLKPSEEIPRFKRHPDSVLTPFHSPRHRRSRGRTAFHIHLRGQGSVGPRFVMSPRRSLRGSPPLPTRACDVAPGTPQGSLIWGWE